MSDKSQQKTNGGYTAVEKVNTYQFLFHVQVKAGETFIVGDWDDISVLAYFCGAGSTGMLIGSNCLSDVARINKLNS